MIAVLMTESPFQKLLNIVARLRDPINGCPWDREQTHSSLKIYLIEECYEVIDAIDRGSSLAEELGDLLLQVLLHSQIASESKSFTITDVITLLTTKLIERHPHVFGETKAANAEEAVKNWERMKQKLKKKDTGILSGVPSGLPSLLRAQRVGEKVGRVGFDWESAEGAGKKVLEEIKEFIDAKDNNLSKDKVAEEFGDLLFSLVQFARKSKLDSEECLRGAINKFTARFQRVEELSGGSLEGKSIDEMEHLWRQVKLEEDLKG